MSVRLPSGSSADGLSQNVLRAILEPNQKVNENDGLAQEKNTSTDQERVLTSQLQQLPKAGGHFLDTTSLSTSSKRSLHSSRLTLSDSKEFFKTVGCRWIRAVRLGDAKTVKIMLEEKPELVHYAPIYGPLALHIATAQANRSIIKLLVARGADVDARDGVGYTSLQLAIRRGNSPLAHFLISQGANIELLDPDGLHITDYDSWTRRDHVSAELHFYGKPMLRPKANSFVCSPTSVSIKSSNSVRPNRPSSTPDSSMCSDSDRSELKRESKRYSWRSIFETFRKKN